jgi:hypothetical protein
LPNMPSMAGYCLCACAEGQFRFLLTLPWQ